MPRLQEIRALFAKLQNTSKGLASIDTKSKASPAQWYRLRAWEMAAEPKGKLRRLVVNSRDKSGELERDFYLKDDDENCASEGSKDKTIDLTREMGRVKECPVINE